MVEVLGVVLRRALLVLVYVYLSGVTGGGRVVIGRFEFRLVGGVTFGCDLVVGRMRGTIICRRCF